MTLVSPSNGKGPAAAQLSAVQQQLKFDLIRNLGAIGIDLGNFRFEAARFLRDLMVNHYLSPPHRTIKSDTPWG